MAVIDGDPGVEVGRIAGAHALSETAVGRVKLIPNSRAGSAGATAAFVIRQGADGGAGDGCSAGDELGVQAVVVVNCGNQGKGNAPTAQRTGVVACVVIVIQRPGSVCAGAVEYAEGGVGLSNGSGAWRRPVVGRAVVGWAVGARRVGVGNIHSQAVIGESVFDVVYAVGASHIRHQDTLLATWANQNNIQIIGRGVAQARQGNGGLEKAGANSGYIDRTRIGVADAVGVRLGNAPAVEGHRRLGNKAQPREQQANEKQRF